MLEGHLVVNSLSVLVKSFERGKGREVWSTELEDA